MADSPQGTMGPINWGSNVVNGALVPQAPSSAFFPSYMGAQYVNPKWPSSAPFMVPPVMPSASQSPVGNNPVIPGQSAGTPDMSNPWHPTRGTIIFGFGALVVGLFMLHYIHYGGGK
jgi:hypothetical protein